MDWKIQQRARFGLTIYRHGPTERGFDSGVELRGCDRVAEPLMQSRVKVPVLRVNAACPNQRTPGFRGDAVRAHAVTTAVHDRFADFVSYFADIGVGLARAGGKQPGTHAESTMRVARAAISQQVCVARCCCREELFFARPVEMEKRKTRRRAQNTMQPPRQGR